MTTQKGKVEQVAEAVEQLDLTSTDAWSDLDELSTHTFIEGVEVEREGIILENENFRGIMNVYLNLQYGANDDEGFSTSDSFRGEFEGHFDGGAVVIDRVSVDTSPFYSD